MIDHEPGGPVVHPLGVCETAKVGSGTRIWAFAHVLPGATIGRDCNLCDHVFIENDVILEDRVTVKSGVQLWDGLRVESDVFIGPNATFTNDRFPRSKEHGSPPLRTIVRRGASVGANATILPGITIGSRAMIGAGAVVTHDVPPYAIVMGNPGRIVGYADSKKMADPKAPETVLRTGSVKGVSLTRLPVFEDLRGVLSVLDFKEHLPFSPMRSFVVSGVPSNHVRGEHAHRVCHQFLICVAGSCRIVTDDSANREEWELDRPSLGLHIPPLVWAVQYKHSPGAVLLVFASHVYDSEDYIREYEEFQTLVR